VAAATQKWRSENYESFRNAQNKWERENGKKRRLQGAPWRSAHADELKEYQKRWKLENRERVRELGRSFDRQKAAAHALATIVFPICQSFEDSE
jgi:hypothetical protein